MQRKQESPKILLRPGKAAAMLGVTLETLRAWHKSGVLEAILTAGGQLRIPQTEVERLLELGAENCVPNNAMRVTLNELYSSIKEPPKERSYLAGIFDNSEEI